MAKLFTITNPQKKVLDSLVKYKNTEVNKKCYTCYIKKLMKNKPSTINYKRRKVILSHEIFDMDMFNSGLAIRYRSKTQEVCYLEYDLVDILNNLKDICSNIADKRSIYMAISYAVYHTNPVYFRVECSLQTYTNENMPLALINKLQHKYRTSHDSKYLDLLIMTLCIDSMYFIIMSWRLTNEIKIRSSITDIYLHDSVPSKDDDIQLVYSYISEHIPLSIYYGDISKVPLDVIDMDKVRSLSISSTCGYPTGIIDALLMSNIVKYKIHKLD